ncbi:MAG: ATP-binding protein, partial [Deltaproteobacteria bacterium]|nr:ATP-binding protein [Deltaproteobacteria bacterium]
PIIREEVEEIFNWILNPLEKESTQIAMVTGKAGCGKTFILKELLKRLKEERIPVLGIKTDITSEQSVQKLSMAGLRHYFF